MAKTPAKIQSTAVAVPDDIDLFGDAGAGSENIGKDDVIIPRLSLVQSMSPELKKTKPEYIEGAEEGSAFNTVTRELYPQPVTVVPVAYNRRFIEWVPREKGGGLVNPDHDPGILDQCQKTDQGKMVLGNGNEVVDTPEHFVLIIKPDGSVQQAVISMSSSKAKVSRRWNSVIQGIQIKNPKTGAMVNPPRWYKTYRVTTVDESNDRGDFKNWRIEPGEDLLSTEGGADVYRMAKQFYELIKAGAVKAEVEEPSNTEAPETEAF